MVAQWLKTVHIQHRLVRGEGGGGGGGGLGGGASLVRWGVAGLGNGAVFGRGGL